ncbi:hypothetical protein RHSIM_Rhsim03G0015400 [Rhododendron simsii]|uniref:RRM domain-containing protein n=1 Tax=Rhododendron simsii TaxID=118357 RepID=A0A834H6P5_RHOSS|nr:hypothetical protein RHSIM_Rhsim03G0015400 [Rhododendron simsii]
MREIGRVGKGSGALDLRKSTVFVDNLPNGIRKGFLYNLFSRFGKIRDCYIPDKKSKRTGQSFGFIRFESIIDAAQAVEFTNRYWIWGRELIANVAKFFKKQGAISTQIYNQYKQKNLEGEDGSRNQRGYNNQHPNSNPQANNGNAIRNGKEVVIYQQNARIQRSTPALKGLEKRGEVVWRRKGVPESSNQGGVGRLRNQEVLSKLLHCLFASPQRVIIAAYINADKKQADNMLMTETVEIQMDSPQQTTRSVDCGIVVMSIMRKYVER